MDCSLPGSSVHRIFQARVMEWVAISFSNENSMVIVRQASVPHLPKDTVAIQYHRRRSGGVFLNSRDQTCP